MSSWVSMLMYGTIICSLCEPLPELNFSPSTGLLQPPFAYIAEKISLLLFTVDWGGVQIIHVNTSCNGIFKLIANQTAP